MGNPDNTAFLVALLVYLLPAVGLSAIGLSIWNIWHGRQVDRLRERWGQAGSFMRDFK